MEPGWAANGNDGLLGYSRPNTAPTTSRADDPPPSTINTDSISEPRTVISNQPGFKRKHREYHNIRGSPLAPTAGHTRAIDA